jgi:glycolate oxidase iron-sulfur subunit
MAATLGQRKAAHIADAGVDMVVTSNPGCILQIRAAMRSATGPPRAEVIHIVELLDRAIRSG